MSPCASTSYESFCPSDSELLENFLNTFQLLSPKQQKIWRVIQWYSQNFRSVFPSQATIAKKAGCHRDTVIQALKKFKEFGWIYHMPRCFRSCVYFIQGILIKIDTKINETFRPKPTENPTEDPTLYNTYSSLSNVRYATQAKNVAVQSIKDQRTQPAAKTEILMKMGITDKKDIYCLSRFDPRMLILAYEDFSTRFAKDPIRNIAAWVTNRCKEHLKKYGG